MTLHFPAPAPMTQSEGIDDQLAESIRKMMAKDRSASVNIVTSDPEAWKSSRDVVFTQVHLVIRKALGFAPCIGPLFDYAWHVAISNDGAHWVAGPSWRVERFDNWVYLADPLTGAQWAVTQNDFI